MGCSDATQSAPVPMGEFSARLAEYACELDFECPASSLGLRPLFQDLSACKAHFSVLASRWQNIPDLIAAVEQGTIIYDAEAAGRCVTVECSADRVGARLPEVCSDVFTGALMEGDTCWRSEECGGDTYCDHGAPTGRDFLESCPGICRARVPIGGSCRYGFQCADPPGRDEGICADGVCARYSPDQGAVEGQKCGETTGEDSAVLNYGKCEDGLWCSSGTCRRGPLPPDSPCNSDDDLCSGFQVCVVVVGRCVDISVAFEGEACGDSLSSPVCNGLAFECVNGRCERPGNGSLGARCFEDIPTTCNEGFQCNYEKICLRLKQVGETCSQDQECESGECGGRCDGDQCVRYCLPRMCRT
ncbi:MAG: hypothetical protein H6729_00740 [Deltaproteobacteria bacterium]|nr:hypothetical protein [Deltaproteobacteria bacterium]